jgi:hypothetical protein
MHLKRTHQRQQLALLARERRGLQRRALTRGDTTPTTSASANRPAVPGSGTDVTVNVTGCGF